MQFKQILTLAMASLATAAVLDLPTMKAAVASVESALTTLDNAVLALSPSSNKETVAADLTSKSEAVLAALKAGTTTIKGTSAISLTDAISFQSASKKLTDIADKTVTDLIIKKPIIDAAGQTKKVAEGMEAQSAATKDFIAALTDKLPSAVRSIAANSAAQANTSLQKGITAFGGKAT